MGPEPKEVLTTTKAAELLQISTKTLLRLARQGDLPGHKLGRSWRFARRELLGRLSGAVGA
jgi:excisionase family DNA binding protein